MTARCGKRTALIVIISILSVIIIAAVTIVGIFFGSNVIQIAIIRAMCTDKPSSTPSNYSEILDSTTLKSVEYADGMTLDIIEPENLPDDALCVMVYHGGYYIGGGRHNQEPFARLLASYGYRVFNVDYALAPENVYPTQLTQANAALNYAADAYPNAEGFVVTGDSAGAHLAAQLAAYVKSEKLRSVRSVGESISPDKLKGFVGSCGFYQASTVKDTGFLFIGDAIEMLVGDKDYINNDVIKELDVIDYAESFPETMLICGDKDPFIVQNNAMRDALTSAGVRVETYFPTSAGNELGHEFQCNYNVDESYTAMDKIVGFLNTL